MAHEFGEREQAIIRKCDEGWYNTIIEGYIKIAFDELGLTDKLEGFSFYRLFDFVGAQEAWERALSADKRRTYGDLLRND